MGLNTRDYRKREKMFFLLGFAFAQIFLFLYLTFVGNPVVNCVEAFYAKISEEK